MLLIGSMDNVVDLSGNEFAKSSVGLPDQVDAFFAKYNYSIENPDIGDVEMNRRGAKDSIAHGIGRIKASSFAAVPHAIEKGKIVDYQKNWKGRQYDTIVLAAPISINDERYYQGVIVIRDILTQRFYLHEVLTEKESDTSFKTGTDAKHTPGDVSPSLISLLKKVRDVNNNFMQKSSDDSAKEIKSSKETATRNIDTLKAERASIVEEYQELKAKIAERKSSAEYVAFDDEIKKIRKNGSLFGGFEAVAKIRNERKKWADESGLTELQDRYSELSEKIHDYDLEIYKFEKAEKEAATIAMTEKVKAFSDSDISKYQTAASQQFGTTNSFDNAGYLMGNGKLLDFSDGQGYRVLDHREVKNVLDFLPEGHNYSDGLIQFMNMGNIRMQIGGIDISKAPNEKQIPVLRKFFDQNNGEIIVDFSKENGDNAGSIKYPKGTSSVKILRDIFRMINQS